MKYYRFDIRLEEDFKEILVAELGELAFEAFEDAEPKLLTAYIQASLHEPAPFNDILKRYEGHIIEVKGPVEEEEKNWNALWESQYEPVIIGDICGIRAPFHNPIANVRFELIIEPKMSFGTGHHATTAGMVAQMAALDFKNKRVLDMGCGTGVLAILAAKLGASEVHAIDIESWAVENSQENAQRNEVNIEVECGTALNMHGSYEVILANINRNIILEDLKRYVSHLADGGTFLCSGFYQVDVDIIREAAALNSLKFVQESNEQGWSVVLFTKLPDAN